MKKAVIFMVSLVVLLVGILAGPILWEGYQSNRTLSPYPDLYVDVVAHTEQIVYPLETAEIVVNVQNYGNEFALFYPFRILLEQKIDDQWHSVPSDIEPDYTYTRVVGAAEGVVPITVSLSDYAQPLTAGAYRFVLHHGENQLFATAEFKLGLAPTENSSRIKWHSEELYAVVYVGYRSITDWETDTLQYQKDLEITRVFDYYEMGGDECFLIIPRYQETEISLYPLDINDAGNSVTSDPLYTQRNGDPFVIFCNQSDIFSNVAVELFVNEETVAFSPQLSGMDGQLVPVERGQDVTQYEPE